jgi:glycosyltransferase involved in cell wall biosynthesis
MDKTLVSIIVPIYNASQWLEACLNSILIQTYPTWKLILVDDGSTDCSPAICDDFAAKDERIQVIHKSNGGVSSARNRGVDSAIGEWVAFVDADDKISPDYLSNLLSGSESDWILGGYKGTDGTVVQLTPEEYAEAQLPKFYNTHFQRLYATVPWGKLYRRCLIVDNQLRFDPKIRLGEDLVFNQQYLAACKSVSLIAPIGYIYTSGGALSEERYHLTLEELDYSINEVNRNCDRLEGIWNAILKRAHTIRIFMSVYPLNKVFKDASRYSEFYRAHLPESTEADFWEDDLCSPVLRSIHKIKFLLKGHRWLDAWKMWRITRRLYGGIIPKIRFKRSNDRGIAFLCRKW